MTDTSDKDINPNDIAIVGLAGRFANCPDVATYWHALKNEIECIRPYSDEDLLKRGVATSDLNDPAYIKAGGMLENTEYFDAGFFGLSPMDAGIMDPQHRHFYECAWEALETAGYVPGQFEGSIGVFAGCGPNTYFMRNVMTNPDLVRSVGFFLLRHTGNDRDFLPTGISYKLNLKGPSVAIQTACSTSLVATHMACQSLLSGECDMALAGGITINIPHGEGYFYRENEIHSPDGHCRAFDAASAGTVITSGAGIVVLRRLEDALADGDYIHAVIKASAINNDGSRKVGYLAPSVDGHAEVVAEALSLAGLKAEDISYIETHGTGTKVGDPIEIAALTEAFRRSTDKKQFCPIGSVKTTIGHTDTAAGIASLIKVTEALKHKTLPASLHYTTPNPRIDFANSPFFVNAHTRPWEITSGPRRAGISSLGVGGTNAHMIVEEAPEPEEADPARAQELLVFSAKTANALDLITQNFAIWLEKNKHINFSDIAYTLQVGREGFEYRRAVAARDAQDALIALKENTPQRIASGKSENSMPSLVFMFPGGGSQYPNMGRELYDTEPVYKKTVDEALHLLRPHIDFDLKALMYPKVGEEDLAKEKLKEVTASICSIFITSYATAQLLISKGFTPDAMTGHSLGEYVAACLAGVFSLEDALKVVALRGRVLGKISHATMLSVAMPHEALEHILAEDFSGSELDVSAINGPELCLVSGPDDQIDHLKAKLDTKETECRKLHIATASHCRLLEPVLPEFRDGLSQMKLNMPTHRFICNVTGTWAKAEDVITPDYWVRHFREPVLFHQGLGELLRDQNRILIEVGPGTTLCSLARQQKTKSRAIISSLRHPSENMSDMQYFLNAIGRLWSVGAKLDWKNWRGDELRQRIPLPTYPFERQRYWIEPGKAAATIDHKAKAQPVRKIENPNDWFFAANWQPSVPPLAAKDESGPVLIFADRSGLAVELADLLKKKKRDVILVREGDSFYKFDEHTYSLAPEEGRNGYDRLFSDLSEQGRMPARIIHAWLVTTKQNFRAGSNFFHRSQERGYYSLTFIMQALGDLDHQAPLHIDVISSGMQAVDHEMVRFPDKATVLGPVRVIPHEFSHVTTRSLDIKIENKSLASELKSLAALLLKDCMGEAAHEIVAYRDGSRYSEVIEATELPEAKAIGFKQHGVYMITGGLGGIGLRIAEHLAKTYHANLILLGQSELPPQSEWDEWLTNHTARDKTAKRIEAIRALEKLGANVMTFAADVANIDRMQEVLKQSLSRFKQIDGVLHAAGTLEDGVMQAKSVEAMERVFTPKVHGTQVLVELFKTIKLDLFILFSSTSSILGPVGQVDYTAANNFLNALSQSEAMKNKNCIAIDWGVWSDVGLGRESAHRIQNGETHAAFLHKVVKHPLIEECLVQTDDENLFSTTLAIDDFWILNEHRTNSGQALIPGTGYLEMARAAFSEILETPTVEISNLSFLTPLSIEKDERKDMRITLTYESGAYAFEVTSRIASEWMTHATGTVKKFTGHKNEQKTDISDLKVKCSQKIAWTKQDQLAFGPRWNVLKEAFFGTHEALATLELDAQFADDLADYHLHPAMMDIATGFALPLLKNYSADKGLFVPLSYGSVKLHAPITQQIISHAQLNPAKNIKGDLAVFDITIFDETGRVLVEISDYVMKHIANAAAFAAGAPSSPTSSSHHSETERLFLETIKCGIHAEEGIAALEKIAPIGKSKPIIVSSIDVPNLILRESEIRISTDTSGVKFERPVLKSTFEAPRDKIEKTLADYWEDLLGVKNIGIHDEFFELGGHSLIAVRLFAKIKKQWGVEYPISALFQAPTIARIADMLRGELGLTLGHDTLGDEQTTETRKTAPQFSLLVPMTKVHNNTKLPFFLVAGMFGNVLNLRHLASHLGEDQTVYALQARGLYGNEKPHNRFEDMAQDYIEEIRKVQPEGPYFLGGFSGGGIIALEMAQQLAALGEKIGILVMLDSIPARIPTADTFDRILIQLLRLKEEGIYYPISWAKRRWEWEMQKRNHRDHELTPAEFRSEEIEAAFRQACAVYEHKPYYGRVDLFKPPAEERYRLGPKKVLNKDREYLDHANHWEQYIPGGINIHTVTGDHDSMVLEPHVRVLAGKLKARLREEQKKAHDTLHGNNGSQKSTVQDAAE